MTVRIAMWSGPRSLSTALLRSFEARGDARVTDEPLYAFYLRRTGLRHPMRDAILASQPQDWPTVAATLTGPCDRPVWYQKHMAHHLLPEIDRGWLAALRHAFLIRDPAAVVASYARARDEVTPDDLGFDRMAEILDHVTGVLGQPPVVIDHGDLLRDPAGMTRALCDALGIPWTARMLSWPAGPRATDGVWASHWYASVERSTGFGPPDPPPPALPEPLRAVVDAITPAWDRLSSLRLRG